jgi:hypothetical protein
MVALRMKEEVAKHPVELLQGIKDPSEGFIWRTGGLLDRLPEPRGQRLILLIDLVTHSHQGDRI